MADKVTLWGSFIQKDKVRDFSNPSILKYLNLDNWDQWGLLEQGRFPVFLTFTVLCKILMRALKQAQ